MMKARKERTLNFSGDWVLDETASTIAGTFYGQLLEYSLICEKPSQLLRLQIAHQEPRFCITRLTTYPNQLKKFVSDLITDGKPHRESYGSFSVGWEKDVLVYTTRLVDFSEVVLFSFGDDSDQLKLSENVCYQG